VDWTMLILVGFLFAIIQTIWQHLLRKMIGLWFKIRSNIIISSAITRYTNLTVKEIKDILHLPYYERERKFKELLSPKIPKDQLNEILTSAGYCVFMEDK